MVAKQQVVKSSLSFKLALSQSKAISEVVAAAKKAKFG